MTLTRFVAVIVFSALTMSACKKEAPPAASDAETGTSAPKPQAAVQAAVEPCTLLTTDQLVAALGESVQAEPSTSGGAQVCTWSAPSGRAVIVQLFSSDSTFDASRQSLERRYEGKAQPIPELGERAFSIFGRTGSLATASVAATRGGRFVVVQIMDPAGTAAHLTPETLELTRSVLPRI